MDKDLQNIDDLFRSAIETYEKAPSSKVLQNLIVLLNEQNKQRSTKLYVFFKAAIIIFLLGISFILNDVNRTLTSYKTSYLQKGKTNNYLIDSAAFKKPNEMSYFMQQIHQRINANKLDKQTKEQAEYNVKSSEATVYKIIKKQIDIITYKETPATLPQNSILNSVVENPVSLNDSFHLNALNTIPRSDLDGTNLSHKIEKNNIVQKFKPYFTITPMALLESAKYNLENNAEQGISNTQQNYKNQIEGEEKHDLSFTTGVLINYQFKYAVGLQAGLMYSNTIISIDPHYIYAVKQASGALAYKFNSSSGYAYLNTSFYTPSNVGDSIATSIAQHSLKYLSLPVMLKYKIGDKKVYFAPSIGLTANLLLASSIKTEIKNPNNEQISITKLYGLKSSYIGYIINTEIGYNLKKGLAVNVQSSCRYALTSINNANVVKTYPYSFGIGIGVSYKF